MPGRVHICVLSVGLDELTRKQQRNSVVVAKALVAAGRFSVFEATANIDIARTIMRLQKLGWFEFDNKSCGFPWTRVELTEVGRAALQDAEEQDG